MTNITLQDIVDQTVEKTNNNYDEAYAHLDKCLEKIRTKPALLNNLGLLFYKKIEYDLACRCFFYLLENHTNQYTCHNNLGLTLNRFGFGEQAQAHYKKALAIKKDYHQARSNLAYVLHYFGETGRSEIKQAHQDIANYVFTHSENYIEGRKQNQTGKINLAYVSSDLRDHAVGRFMIGILEKHNRDNFKVHVFDNRPNNNDATAQRLKKLDIQWNDISSLDTKEACTLIAEQGIDILIDLSGHTNGGRPDIFSNRVAPAQITYLGYPNTSGLSQMDFRIGDVFADPKCNADQNTETMLRLPTPMWNYTPWPNMPSTEVSPFLQNGHITFGSANNHAKLQVEWLDVWAKALNAVPRSRFKIKSRALKNPKTAADFLDFFKERGVSSDRIDIEHFSANKAEHWKILSSFDIALDSYPYNGTTTSCDLIWLGVPILTRQGNSHVSRTTASLLNGIGMESWVADSDEHFIELAKEKASNHLEILKCRQNLQTWAQNSSIGHSDLFIVEYEKLLQTAWSETCDKSS